MTFQQYLFELLCLSVVFWHYIFLMIISALWQSMIGRKMLELQLRRLGIFDAGETISSHKHFDDCFKVCKFSINPINLSALTSCLNHFHIFLRFTFYLATNI